MTHEKYQFIAFVLAAECAWNGGPTEDAAHLHYDPAKVFDRFYGPMRLLFTRRQADYVLCYNKPKNGRLRRKPALISDDPNRSRMMEDPLRARMALAPSVPPPRTLSLSALAGKRLRGGW